MTKTLVTLIFAFVLVFAAGAAVGLHRNAARLSALPMDPGSQLAEQLNLTDAQREKMKAIWQPIASANHQRNDQRRTLDAQRDAEVAAMLTPDQLVKFGAIQAKYHQQMDALDAARHNAFAAAEDATRAILDPKQLAKYEEILKARHPQPTTQPETTAATPSPSTQP